MARRLDKMIKLIQGRGMDRGMELASMVKVPKSHIHQISTRKEGQLLKLIQKSPNKGIHTIELHNN